VCRHRAVISYFGEHVEDCGGPCDVCGSNKLGDIVKSGPIEKPKTYMQAHTVPAPVYEASGGDSLLFILKKKRRAIADELDVPSYVIFNDAVLSQLAKKQPETRQEMLAISGIGDAKMDAYGDTFLTVIRDYKNENTSKSDTIYFPCVSSEKNFGAFMKKVENFDGHEIFTKTGKRFVYRKSGNTLLIHGSSWNINLDDLKKAHDMWPVKKPSEFEKAGLKSSGSYLWAVLNTLAQEKVKV
jgi:hypothetical protein